MTLSRAPMHTLQWVGQGAGPGWRQCGKHVTNTRESDGGRVPPGRRQDATAHNSADGFNSFQPTVGPNDPSPSRQSISEGPLEARCTRNLEKNRHPVPRNTSDLERVGGDLERVGGACGDIQGPRRGRRAHGEGSYRPRRRRWRKPGWGARFGATLSQDVAKNPKTKVG
jgi:hypothetical protein